MGEVTLLGEPQGEGRTSMITWTKTQETTDTMRLVVQTVRARSFGHVVLAERAATVLDLRAALESLTDEEREAMGIVLEVER